MALIDIENNHWEAAERFVPHANQDQYRSAWAVLEGTPTPGWNTVAELSAPQQYSTINKIGSGYTIFKEKNGKEHTVKIGNMTLVEMVVPAEEMLDKQKLEGRVSQQNVDGIIDRDDKNYVALGGGIEQPLQDHGRTPTGIDAALLQEQLALHQNQTR